MDNSGALSSLVVVLLPRATYNRTHTVEGGCFLVCVLASTHLEVIKNNNCLEWKNGRDKYKKKRAEAFGE
jgi:hypothetical protein